MKLLQLFWVFFKVGLLAFGGGYTLIAMARTVLVERKKWLTDNELMDYFAMSQSLPGIITINFSAFIGYKQARFLGALTAVTGVITGPVAVVILLAGIVEHINEYPLLISALKGIQIAVCALILSFAMSLFRQSVQGYGAVLLYLMTVVFYLWLGLSPAWLLIAGGLIGWGYYRMEGQVLKQ